MPKSGATSESAVTRRELLIGGGAAIGATAITAAGAFAFGVSKTDSDLAGSSNLTGDQVEPFFGKNQSGIQTAIQSHGMFAVFKLKRQTSRGEIAGVMKAATIEASRLCSGKPGLSDTDPRLADFPARLTITFGFGINIFESAGLKSKIPEGFKTIPKQKIDQLQEMWSGETS